MGTLEAAFGRSAGWGWHLAAAAVLALGAVANAWPWFVHDRMPPGDYSGYVAQVQFVRDALLEHGRVPLWCVECFGGASLFTPHLKEYLVFPLALALDPVPATQLAYLVLRVLGGLGLYGLTLRLFGAPLAGIVAGYAYAFGAIANHHTEMLDLALASALMPPLVLAAVVAVQRRSATAVIALGALAAAQLLNNWVHALSVPVVVAVLMLGRPWEAGATAVAAGPWWRRAGVARVAAALGVCLVLAGSQLAWVAADARHHALLSDEMLELGRRHFVERSPFLLINRDNALAGWLADHQPPGIDITVWDQGGSYLGLAVLATCVGAGAALRRRPVLAAWARVGAGMSLFVYWLSLGPNTLLWQLAASFGLSPATQSALRGVGIAAAAACLALAGWTVDARRRGAAPRGRIALEPLLWAALLLLLPCVSLWSALERVLPPLQMQRSPGHFFEMLPFWLGLAFAAALAAIAHHLARPRLALACVAAIGVAVVVDYWPSHRRFDEGTPMRFLERPAALLRDVEGEGGTLRMAVPQKFDPRLSWIAAQAPTGYARGWLTWQAGRHWNEFFLEATYGYEDDAPWPELMRIARVRYFLLSDVVDLPAPWRTRTRWGNLRLWELPEVAPPASGYRAWTRLALEPGEALAPRIAAAVRANALIVGEEVEHGIARPRDPPGPEPFPVAYRRPGPERISLEVDAGEEPALVFVSEGYHPWWRVAVDGEPGLLWRAQHTFLAVPVPAGRHAVELRFEPPGWLRAVHRISQLGWAALAVAALVALARRRRKTARA